MAGAGSDSTAGALAGAGAGAEEWAPGEKHPLEKMLLLGGCCRVPRAASLALPLTALPLMLPGAPSQLSRVVAGWRTTRPSEIGSVRPQLCSLSGGDMGPSGAE